MPLSNDIKALRDRVLDDLNAAHDYFAETTLAWSLVDEIIKTGRTLSVRNATTGTVTTQVELAARAPGYVAEQLTEATFQQFISIFENFFLDLLRLWLTAYPRSLGKRNVDFKSVLDLPDRDAIVQLVVMKELNEVLYDRPSGWFDYLKNLTSIDGLSADEIERIAEAKASRDLLVHNRGIVNAIYRSKAGKLARFREGERIDISEPYHRETWELIRKVVADVANATIAKAA